MGSENTSVKTQAAPTLDVIINRLAAILQHQEELAFATSQKITSIKMCSKLELVDDKLMEEPNDACSRLLYIASLFETVTERQVKNLDYLSEIV